MCGRPHALLLTAGHARLGLVGPALVARVATRKVVVAAAAVLIDERGSEEYEGAQIKISEGAWVRH